MRNKKLTRLLMSLAAAPALSAAMPANSQENPEDAFSAMSVDGKRIYAKPETLKAGERYLIEMSKMAGRDILFIEPSNLEAEDLDGFKTIPVLNAAFPPLKLQKPQVSGSGITNDFLLKSRESDKDFLFINLLVTSGAYAKGRNYVSLPFNQYAQKACIVMGDLDIDSSKLAQNLGSIPADRLTEDFKNIFADPKSLLTLVLLHEAAHCTQSSAPSVNESHTVLHYEIDADQRALKRYRELIAEGWELDPQLPEKFHYLRLLAPLLGSQGNAKSVMMNLMQNHATAPALNKVAPDAKEISQKTFQSVLLQRSVVYELVDHETHERLRPKAQEQVDKLFAQFTDGLDGKIPRMRKAISDLIAGLNNLKPVMVNLTMTDMVLKENPALSYEALKVLAAHGWKNDKNEIEPYIGEMAKESLMAWDGLFLQRPDRAIPDLGLAEGQPLQMDRLDIMESFTALRKDWNSPRP